MHHYLKTYASKVEKLNKYKKLLHYKEIYKLRSLKQN